GGYGRARSQSLFRRAYTYAPDGSGLEGVPIQVWSSKSFAGSWERPLDNANPPFSADIRDEGQGRLTGTITNNLSIPLDSPCIIYGGDSGGAMVYSFDQSLQPNVATPITLKNIKQLSNWPDSAAPSGPQNYGNVASMTSDNIFKRLIYFSKYASAG